MPVTTKATEAALVRMGLEVVFSGKLKDIRDKVGVSATVQAHMIGVAPTMIHSWESGKTHPTSRSAVKVATWYRLALDELNSSELRSGNLVHVSVASQYLGLSYVSMADWCRRGLVGCVDHGVLGTYVYRDQIGSL